MGLSAFSRARVSNLPVLELEAARFDKWNKAQNDSRQALDRLQNGEEFDAAVEEVREADGEAVIAIGEKVVAGMEADEAERDMPLREDHLADMVGRRHVEEPQGEPKSTLERLHDRIPTETTASKVVLHKLVVDGEGPTKEEMDAAYEEQEPWSPEGREVTDDPDEAPDDELPAAGEGAGVAGETTDGEVRKVVPKTTKVEARPKAKVPVKK